MTSKYIGGPLESIYYPGKLDNRKPTLKLYLKNHGAPAIKVICKDEGLFWKGWKAEKFEIGMPYCWPKMAWRIVGEWE